MEEEEEEEADGAPPNRDSRDHGELLRLCMPRDDGRRDAVVEKAAAAAAAAATAAFSGVALCRALELHSDENSRVVAGVAFSSSSRPPESGLLRFLGDSFSLESWLGGGDAASIITSSCLGVCLTSLRGGRRGGTLDERCWSVWSGGSSGACVCVGRMQSCEISPPDE